MAYRVSLTAPAETDAYAAFERIREAAPMRAEKCVAGENVRLKSGTSMIVNHYKPGKFRARLTVRGVPRASHYDFEVGAAASPEAAVEIAMRSPAWQRHIVDSASFAQAFRYLESGELQAAPSFVGLPNVSG